jgi:4-alpha-glucanotransferase
VRSELGKEYGSLTAYNYTPRRAGIILHPTSLPGQYGTGEIGEEAFYFVDWLVSAGMQVSFHYRLQLLA